MEKFNSVAKEMGEPDMKSSDLETVIVSADEEQLHVEIRPMEIIFTDELNRRYGVCNWTAEPIPLEDTYKYRLTVKLGDEEAVREAMTFQDACMYMGIYGKYLETTAVFELKPDSIYKGFAVDEVLENSVIIRELESGKTFEIRLGRTNYFNL